MPLKIQVQSTAYGQPPVMLFERIKGRGVDDSTVVKVKRMPSAWGWYEITLAKVKWSKYRIINKVKKLFIRIKYM